MLKSRAKHHYKPKRSKLHNTYDTPLKPETQPFARHPHTHAGFALFMTSHEIKPGWNAIRAHYEKKINLVFRL